MMGYFLSTATLSDIEATSHMIMLNLNYFKQIWVSVALATFRALSRHMWLVALV
jgi:hypothetical protein